MLQRSQGRVAFANRFQQTEKAVQEYVGSNSQSGNKHLSGHDCRRRFCRVGGARFVGIGDGPGRYSVLRSNMVRSKLRPFRPKDD